ncbi:hypothetical protein [Bacillus pinisoli]|uniref:hypothetical protein n=1 Tax=Bacillus pinisoli TaxID=2901866 RepID=UPI001FF5E830|nr:hypothetical protein [Bacillus pinisoli]
MTKYNKEMPDFDSLSDRVIAKPTETPIFAIKTNLDSDSPKEDNPYYTETNTKNEREELDKFFRNS